MAKKNNDNNSDWMAGKQDERLEQLEEKLTALYANAENEIRSEYTDFTKKFEKQDARLAAQVEAGEIPKDEYIAWRKTEILKSNQYSKAVESMSNMLVNTDVAAMATINGELPQVVAESYDFVQALGFEAADKANMSTGTFQIYNADTVEILIRDNPDLLPKASKNTIESLGGTVDIPEDKKWAKDRINREITQGIVQGKSLPKIAESLSKVTTMDKNAAKRNARTAMTAAENMGRAASAKDLKENGIPVQEVWSASGDDHVRESHQELDGTTKNEAGYYGEGIIARPLRYPGDPDGDPEEVYNCRCRENVVLAGIDHSRDDELYEEFMKQFNEAEEYKGFYPEGEQPEPAAESQAEPIKEFSNREQAELMEHYIADEGYDMNSVARFGDAADIRNAEGYDLAEIKEMTTDFTLLMDQQKLEQEAIVYRGGTADTITQSLGLTREEIIANPDQLIGQEIVEKGFMSTSPDRQTANDYAGGDVFWQISLPEGATAVDMNEALHGNLGGQEITIQRDTHLVIEQAYVRQFDSEGNPYDNGGYLQIVARYEYSDPHDENGNPITEKTEEPIATSRSEDLPSIDELLPAEDLTSGEREVVQGENLVGSWSRREDKFDFEIDDIVDAQGFNGLPKVVSEEEFNKAVEKSGFIAQRAYSAEDAETLASYKDQLYNGDFYVDCSTGGAAYGQGMYAAGNFDGKLTESMAEEMKYYTETSFGDFTRIETFTVTEDFKTIDFKDIKPEYFFRYCEEKYADNEEVMAAVEKGREQLEEGVRGRPYYKDIRETVKEEIGEEEYASLKEFYDSNIGLDSEGYVDEGVIAAMMGYDGIATGEVTPNISAKVDAKESQHVVILNRTKVIFKEDEA